MYSRTHRSTLRALCVAILTLVLFVFVSALAASAVYAAEQQVSIDVRQAYPSVGTNGALVASVNVTVTEPADYLEVRLRLRTPTGRLVYQKTEIRSDLPAGRHAIPFDYDFAGKGLGPGRYPIELRVLATGSGATQAADRLLIVDENATPLPVAVVASVMTTPSVDGDGRFMRDPGREDHVRATLAYLAQLARGSTSPFGLLVAPVLIEELERAGSGYTTVDGQTVDSSSETAGRYARTVSDLRDVLASGKLALVDVPYALPDSRTASTTAEFDVQWRFTDSVFAGMLRSDTASATAFVGPQLTSEALDSLAARGTRAVLAPPSALGAGDGRTEPGCYSVGDSGVCVLAIDELAASAATLGDSAFYEVMHERFEAGTPSVIVLELGSGSDRATQAATVLEWIEAVPWLEPVSLGEVSIGAGGAETALAPMPEPTAPAGHWDTIDRARILAGAFAEAAGPDDTDAIAAIRASLVAQSGLWSLPEGSWAGAPTAQSIAESARAFTEAQLSSVRLDVKDVTLAGRDGELPLTLVNGSGRPLTLTLVPTSESVRTPKQRIAVTAEDGTTFLEVPVDLGSSSGGALLVEVYAGTYKVTEAIVKVRPSYIDRMATIAMVFIVLLTMLFFIHRRVSSTNAGTISEDD